MVSALRCATHPDVETGLRCGKCDKLICPRCLVHTPVGARCKDCARLRKLPTYDVSLVQYVKATLVGAGLALGFGVLWLIVGVFIPYGAFVIPLIVGFAIGELISLSVNRKRGTGLQAVAGASVFLSYFISKGGSLLGMLGIFVLLGLAIGIFVVASRLR